MADIPRLFVPKGRLRVDAPKHGDADHPAPTWQQPPATPWRVTSQPPVDWTPLHKEHEP